MRPTHNLPLRTLKSSWAARIRSEWWARTRRSRRWMRPAKLTGSGRGICALAHYRYQLAQAMSGRGGQGRCAHCGAAPVSGTADWLKAFDAIAVLKPQVIVPGHGRPTSLEGAKAATRDYLE